MDLKGAQRKLIVRRNKNKLRQGPNFKRLDYVEPIDSRHLYIQEYEIRFVPLDNFKGSVAIGGFANYFYLGLGFEKADDLAARRTLVINNNCANLRIAIHSFFNQFLAKYETETERERSGLLDQR